MTFSATDHDAVSQFIRECGAGVIATLGDDGRPQAAFVGIAVASDGTIVLDANVSSRKVANVEARPEVAIAITGSDVSVQVEGHARVTRDSERERLGEVYNSQFPGSRALDDGFCVIAVDVNWVRVYDARIQPPHVSEATWR